MTYTEDEIWALEDELDDRLQDLWPYLEHIAPFSRTGDHVKLALLRYIDRLDVHMWSIVRDDGVVIVKRAHVLDVQEQLRYLRKHRPSRKYRAVKNYEP